ncbi:G-type lectin S-receptor-like serine/threonine-protein kinase At4g27290 [Pyrus communis]|uniref:G-type lectin S-receptor-like serine/threonine-protein kinase At4g27290 n=1 Tax=Pyrus communis TaxID=23211 RepID=UPI0035C0FE69
MEIFTMLFVLSSFLFFPSISTTKDIITPTVSLRDGESLVSSGGTFELGFFSPGNSKNRYVGIWYNGISPQIVVWVANRETPLTDHYGALNITNGGVLVLFSDKNSSMWSSNFTSRTLRSPVAQLLESGNLVVKDGNDDNSESTLVWQSFDYPGNTLLPGMKLGWNSATGINRFLSSWKAAEDPSPGEFSYSIDHSGYPQLVLRKGRVPHYRLGSWNGLGFTGSPELTPNEAFKIEFVSNDSEAYYKFDLMKDKMHSRLVLNLSGGLQRFLWIDKTHSGNIFYSAPADRCDTYDLCGAFAFCKLDSDPLCSCLQGFVPNSPRDYLKNTSSGCLRKGPSGCTNQDEFQKFIRVKLPDTSSSRINKTMSLEECKKMCLTNCSCTAYANLDVRGGGTGCLLWFGNLIDIKEFDSGGQDLFVRIPPSELDGTKTSKLSGVKRKVAIIVSCGAVVTGVLILGLVFYIRKKKLKARGNMKNIREKNFGFEGGSEDMELITFDLATVSRATDNFSNNNKLGQGGFGPVYKGILEEGQNIAVKRLSKCSGQGIKEFMNEVVLIAKLQHRNLVKLLGCCIEGDEKMLIYEYMPNKSLDYFIFDDTRSKLLNWDQRINIIGGIARGLLYLHQDSRLRIIHRDLKISNVLLDKDMNPKISDFGTARAFGGDQTEENTNRVVGTYGYMSPEYVVDGLFSVKSDVYSFGVMMLEILSGKKNRGFHHPDHQLNLLGHAWMLWIEGIPTEIMDEKLDGSCALPEVSRSIHIALLCVQQQPEDRPNMASVVLMLGGEGSLPIPKQPGFFTERNSVEAKASSPSKYESHSINEMSLTLLEARF